MTLPITENRGFSHRGLLRSHGRHPEVVRDWIHSVLPIERRKLLAENTLAKFQLVGRNHIAIIMKLSLSDLSEN